MDEYIKREDACYAAGLIALASVDREITCGEVQQIMNSIPAADVVERKKGKWEFREEFFAYGIAHFDCSICGESVLERTRFCPNCGADMRGEDDG